MYIQYISLLIKLFIKRSVTTCIVWIAQIIYLTGSIQLFPIKPFDYKLHVYTMIMYGRVLCDVVFFILSHKRVRQLLLNQATLMP